VPQLHKHHSFHSVLIHNLCISHTIRQENNRFNSLSCSGITHLPLSLYSSHTIAIVIAQHVQTISTTRNNTEITERASTTHRLKSCAQAHPDRSPATSCVQACPRRSSPANPSVNCEAEAELRRGRGLGERGHRLGMSIGMRLRVG
jgi:hypothetical protein